MIVRRYQNRHNASFLQLVRSMADERNVYDSVDYQLMDMYFYEDYILMNEDYITLVAEDAVGDVVGFIVGTIRMDSVDIKILFVDKELRRSGFGKLLKQQMTKQAFELGKKSITAHNAYSNPASLQLNNMLGWTIIPAGEPELINDEYVQPDYYKAELVFDNKTIDQWDEIAGQNILDPDGFDRKDPFLGLRRFSKEEYIKGTMFSTIQVTDREKNVSFFNISNGENNG